MNDDLQKLADQADALAQEQAQAQAQADLTPQQQQAQADALEQEAQSKEAMQQAFSGMAFGLLKAVRARIAAKLPEIEAEWTDATLQGVADAVFPVADKYMARWMPTLTAYPEESALAMAALPLALGYFSAIGKHDKAQKNKLQGSTTAKPGAVAEEAGFA